MTNHARLAFVLTGLLLGTAAAGRAPIPPPKPGKRFVSEQALKNLECVTRWEQICAEDPERRHQLELQRSKVKYLAASEGNVEYAIVSKKRKALQLAPPGTRQAVATVKLEKNSAVYKGPDHVPSPCEHPNCAQVPECEPPAGTVTVRFVSETLLAQRLRELMSLVPEKQCPSTKPGYAPAQAGETCLNSGKPYTPETSPTPKRASVRLDSQPLRLFLSNEERALVEHEAKPLLAVLQPFYASRLARAPKARGTVTVRLHFPEGNFRPEVSVQQDEPRDAKLTECLSAALRSRELFSWRPTQVADLELAFVFKP